MVNPLNEAEDMPNLLTLVTKALAWIEPEGGAILRWDAADLAMADCPWGVFRL